MSPGLRPQYRCKRCEPASHVHDKKGEEVRQESRSRDETLTDGKGVTVPMTKEMKFVTEVMLMETAASAYVRPKRSGTERR